MKWTFPDNLIAGFIRYDLCKTCKTDNNHQRDSCINCRNKREAPEILRDFCRTMMTIVNELLGLSKAYKFPFGAVRNAFYWHFCQRQKAEITHAFNLITHRPHFFLNKPNLIGIVGQFGTGQFGNVNLAPRVKTNNCPGVKLSVFTMLVPNCLFAFLVPKCRFYYHGAKLSGVKLSWCKILRCQIALPPS